MDDKVSNAEWTEPRAGVEPASAGVRLDGDDSYRDLVENAGVGIYRSTPQGRILLANPALVRMLGYECTESLTERDLSDPEIEFAVERKRFIERIERDGRVHGIEATWTQADGTALVIRENARAVRDAEGNTLYYEGTVEDITEQKRAEEALRESETRYRLLAENQSDLILTLDLSGNPTYVSPSVRTMLGLVADDVVESGLQDLLRPRSYVRAVRTIRTAIDAAHTPGLGSASPEVLELEWAHVDGTSVWTEARIGALRGPDQTLGGFLLVARDVSERKRAEEERERLRFQLHQADKMTTVGQLAAGVAHEINNPVSFVLPNLELLKESLAALVALQERGAPDDLDRARDIAREMPQLVDECLEGMRRVRSTTGELRQFSRAEDSEPEEVQLAELMDSSLVLASSEIRYRAQVIKDYQPVPSLVVYRSKLAQVFLNIVVNAAQAIETGGVEDNWIRVSTGRDGGGIYAEIANSGSVIPPEVSRRIFDPFFTTKRRDKGTGLGLAIAMSTVQQHRGQISVRSDEHTGTVFRVWLPLDTGLQVERRATVRVSGERERACRILVVEDERYILNFMRRLLSKRHEVQTASGGREAMDLLARDRAFDLIFCDLMMPEIGGIDVYEWVTLEYPDLADRFVFMTGGAFTPRGRGFVQRMGDRVLQKPVGAAQLLEAVQHYASTH